MQCDAIDLRNEAEFRGGIASTIPSFIKQLDNESGFVREGTVRLIGKLASHGK
jgi:hypothetical protein